jgi:aspartyl-tRNA(Asn)/glutamyl-tRNA(Gln) amidotransferase subunit B
VEDQGITVSQRSKEHAHDYRYFPEPDLPPLIIDRNWVQALKSKLPELPDEKRDRLMSQYSLPRYDAVLLTSSRGTADFFERAMALHPNAKSVGNWMTGELFRLLNASGTEIEHSKVTPEHLAELLSLIDQGAISASVGKVVLEDAFASGKRPGEIVQERGLTQISGVDELGAIVDQVLAANSQAVADYHAGKAPAIGFLVGQVMKASRGKANPGVVNQLLREKLGS